MKEYLFIERGSPEEQMKVFMENVGKKVPVILPGKLTPDMLSGIEIPSQAEFAVATSGTTGKPKVYFRTLRSWSDFFDEQNRCFQITKNSRIFIHGNLAFTGNLNLVADAKLNGIYLFCSGEKRPQVWAQQIVEHKINYIYMIPDKLLHLCRTGFTFSDIRTVLCGSQKVSRDLFQKMKKTFPNATFYSYYGASEVNYIAYKKLDEENLAEDRMGEIFDGVKVTISRENHILVENPFTVCGLELPYDTKDTGYLKDGELYLTGRCDDTLNIGGEKLNKSILIAKLKNIQGVEDCEVTVFERNGKQRIRAHIQGEQNKFMKSENAFEGIPQVYIPADYVFYNALPRNDSGKIDFQFLAGRR